MSRRGGLGRGLESLIPANLPTPTPGLEEIPVNRILPNPRQPRREMDEIELSGLAESIREHGILQPLVVTSNPAQGDYTLIAGERRLRAALLAGLSTVPAIVREVDEQQRLELALIENIQREALQPLETAHAYQQLADEFGLRHEDIATRVGKSRAAVSNTLRLLQLPEEVQEALRSGRISEGHARTLLGLTNAIAQVSVLKTILDRNLSVRQTEELVRKLAGNRPARKSRQEPPAEIQEIETRLRSALGTRVNLHHGKKGGSLIIYYYSDEELQGIIEQITGGGLD